MAVNGLSFTWILITGEKTEEEDEVASLQLAWEILELAKVIYEKYVIYCFVIIETTLVEFSRSL